MTTLFISANDAHQTLFNYLKKLFPTLLLSQIYRLVRTKKIRINGKTITDFKYRLQENDVIAIYAPHLPVVYEPAKIAPTDPVIVFYEDENFLIVNKDHNVVVHQPYGPHLDNMVRYYLQEQNKHQAREQTFTISHQYRLDKLTKGLIIYPKNKISQTIFYEAGINGKITKKYLAICQGKLTQPVTITGYLTHDETQMKMVFSYNATTNSKSCQTILTPLFTNNRYTLIECQLITGRKHQIRSTLSFLNLPIVGDNKYGSTIKTPHKIALFAYYLSFHDLEQPLSYLNNQEFILKDLKSYLINQIKTEKW